MKDLLFIILIILVIIFIYRATDTNVTIYNDKKYFEKFRKKRISKLKSNNKLSTPNTKKNKILIITYDNRPELSYIKIHNENLTAYCAKFNIEYRFYDKCEYNNYWCKMYMLLQELKTNKYDFVVWMDSDTYIFNTSINISDIFNKYSSDVFIGSDNNSDYDLTNAGVFAVKNTDDGKQFLADCINSFNSQCKKPNGELKGQWAATCYEQGIMNILIADKYYKHTTVLTNDIIFNYNRCNNNVFIMHLYASSAEYRTKCFNSKNNSTSEISETSETRDENQ
jgi:hypothetical protein